MIRKNILAIALLGAFGLSHAADVENLRTLSYLNEPLRLQADVIGEGDIILAAPTEYLRLNHPIPSYDLSINIVEQNGQKQVVLTTTEEIESPALTLLLESRDQDNRRQLFELPIILDFKSEPVAEDSMAETTDAEIVIDGVEIAPSVAAATTEDKVVLADVPAVGKEATIAEPKVADKPTVAAVKEEPVAAKTPSAAPTVSSANAELVKRYSVEKGETLWSIANKVRPTNVTPQKMIEIIKANNPSAFTANGVLRADVTLLIPAETPKVQHKFVATTETGDKADIRIGYIYELPEPPVQKAAESVNTQTTDVAVVDQNDEVTVKVVRPIVSDAEAVTQELTTISPDNDQSVETVEVTQPTIVEPQQVVNTIPAETIAPVVDSAVEVAQPDTVELVKAVEPVKEEVAQPVEPPKKRPVYIMPEPEPEPSIVELIFENIVYIGAGALALILGLLAVVMRRRKQSDEPKQPKEKKAKAVKAPKEKSKKAEKESKGVFGFGKKKAAATPVEASVTEAPIVAPVEEKAVEKPQAAPIAAAVVTAAVVADAVADKVELAKTETNDEPPIESLDFDLSFTEEAPISDVVATEEKEEAGLDFDLSSLDLNTTVVEAEVPQEDSVGGLDFDLSSLDLSSEIAVDVAKEEESVGGLDFDLSTLDLGSTTFETKADDQTEDYGGLDFDLSTFSTEIEKVDVPEESFDMGTALDFDLGDFKVEPEPVVEIAVEEGIEMPVDPITTENSFGENNPLFTPQAALVEEAKEVQPTTDTVAPQEEEYISFPDLLENAEDALVRDDIEAEKPADFDNFLEDAEAGLANLMEASKKSEIVEPKLDLSFVADTDEDAESVAFLESLDKSDEVVLDDPINSSVKDNVAKSMEVVDAPEPISIDMDALDLPTFEEPVVTEIDAPEITLVEPVIEAPMVEDVVIPEVTLVEPTIEPIVEEVVIPEITLPELEVEVAPTPVVEPVSEPVTETPVVVETLDANDADFESEQVKLELAVAYMDFDKSLARPLLDEVMKDGSPKQIERAQALLAQID